MTYSLDMTLRLIPMLHFYTLIRSLPAWNSKMICIIFFSSYIVMKMILRSVVSYM